MKLGMNSEQMAEQFCKILDENKEEFCKAVNEEVEGVNNKDELISRMVWACSTKVIPTAIFGVIESNNEVISKQIASILEQLPAIFLKEE